MKSSIREAEETLVIAAVLVVHHHLRLPAQPPGDDHPRARDPDVHRRDVRDHVLPRLLDQQLHPAGADAGHRHRGGRRDHRAGERLPAPGRAGREPRGRRRSTAPGRSPSPCIATTIALVAVFTPLAFLKGSTGRLFNEFGIAVAGSVIISGFVALTLTPMLCAKILRVPQRHGRLYRALEEGFNRLAVRLRPDPGAGAAAPDDRGRAARSRSRWRRCSSSARWSGSSCRPRIAAGSSPSSSRRRAPRWPTPTSTSAGPRRSRPRRRRSTATSAWSTSATA